MEIIAWYVALPWLIGAAGLSLILAGGSRALASRIGAIDMPKGGRKIHQVPIPLLGGIGIGLTILVGLLGYFLFFQYLITDTFLVQLVGFAFAICILLIGGLLDDKFDLHPFWQFGFIVAACLLAVLTGTNVSRITNWTGGAPLELGFFGSLLAFGWLLVVTLAMKFMDGLDGLVSGQAVIGAILIALLGFSPAYNQPEVAILALIIAGAFLGFLPVNFHPAKQFLGESGAWIAGFSLGFLSILGGAKLAIGLMALAFPLMDALLVVVGRIARGTSPFKGDDTHLHFKLLRAGLSQRQTVFIIWMISLAFGLTALGLQTRGKIMLLVVLAIVTALLSYFAGRKRAAASNLE